MKKKSTQYLIEGAVIAAVYAAITYVAASLGWAYGPVQFRFSEALTVLAAFTPAAIPGLTIGCFLGNLGSPYGWVDIIFGTLASFLAASTGYYLRKINIKGIPFLVLLMPVLFNGIIIGLEVTPFIPNSSWLTAYLIGAGWIALGEFAMCFGLGSLLHTALIKTKIFK
ncbi:MAG: hypothetical protein BGN88_11215 [Clostridiales bacterium 43-6]|nr:MAG: hypothetical protein BGN88_11215 [Clostridiales bacterium 43-6]